MHFRNSGKYGKKRQKEKGSERTLLLPPPRSPHLETLSPSLFYTFFLNSRIRTACTTLCRPCYSTVCSHRPRPPNLLHGRCPWCLRSIPSGGEVRVEQSLPLATHRPFFFFANLSSHRMISPRNAASVHRLQRECRAGRPGFRSCQPRTGYVSTSESFAPWCPGTFIS